MAAYPKVRLADIAADVSYGYTARATRESVGPKFLRITDIAQDRLDWDGVPYCRISDVDHEKYRLRDGDIVIARTGATVGHSKTIRDAPDSVYASYLIRVRLDQHHDPQYVGYVVGSSEYKQFVLANAGGAAQPNANAKVLTSFPLPVPRLEIQRKIASVLSPYDDLIENNRRRIKLLEETAQRIYREWFVHFRFPGHEHFPLVASDLGPVPSGWEIKTMADVCRQITDGAHASPPSTDDGLPMASVKDMADFSLDLEHCRRISASDFEAVTRQRCKPLSGDVLISKDGAKYLEKAFPVFGDLNAVLLSSVAILRPGDLVTPTFLALMAKEPQTRTRMKGLVSGAAIPRVVLKDLKTFQLALPPTDVLRRFDDIASPVLQLVIHYETVNRTLAAVRDLLLTPLVSGQMDVERLDIVVGETAA